jgi:rubredoxin
MPTDAERHRTLAEAVREIEALPAPIIAEDDEAYGGIPMISRDDVLAILARVPAAPTGAERDRDGMRTFYCRVCRFSGHEWPGMPSTRYCPNCGATLRAQEPTEERTPT